MKVCIKCKVEKPLDQFYRYKKMKDGRRNDCRTCAVKYARENVVPLTHVDKPKTYEDYLKESGQYENYKRNIRYYTLT